MDSKKFDLYEEKLALQTPPQQRKKNNRSEWEMNVAFRITVKFRRN